MNEEKWKRFNKDDGREECTDERRGARVEGGEERRKKCTREREKLEEERETEGGGRRERGVDGGKETRN